MPKKRAIRAGRESSRSNRRRYRKCSNRSKLSSNFRQANRSTYRSITSASTTPTTSSTPQGNQVFSINGGALSLIPNNNNNGNNSNGNNNTGNQRHYSNIGRWNVFSSGSGSTNRRSSASSTNTLGTSIASNVSNANRPFTFNTSFSTGGNNTFVSGWTSGANNNGSVGTYAGNHNTGNHARNFGLNNHRNPAANNPLYIADIEITIEPLEVTNLKRATKLKIHQDFTLLKGMTKVTVPFRFYDAITGWCNMVKAKKQEIKKQITDRVHEVVHKNVVGQNFARISNRKFFSETTKKWKTWRGSMCSIKEDEGPSWRQDGGCSSASVSGGTKRKHCEVEGDDKESCIICFYDYKEGEILKRLSCGHEFHPNCLRSWLKNHGTCPVCRGCALCRNQDDFVVNFR